MRETLCEEWRNCQRHATHKMPNRKKIATKLNFEQIKKSTIRTQVALQVLKGLIVGDLNAK